MKKSWLNKISIVLISMGLLAGCSSNESTQGKSIKETSVEQEARQVVEDETVVVSINIIVDNKVIEKFSHEYEVPYGFKVIDIMKEHYRIVEKDGFIQCIEGNRQDEKNGIFWIYDVNGETSKIGSDQYELQDGDIVDWKLTKIE